MISLGISPGDGLKILEYNEAAWFLSEVGKIRKKKDIVDMLNIAEAHRMAIIGASPSKSNSNHKNYMRWVAELKNKIADPVESGEETLFDQLKKRIKVKKPKTLIERLNMK